MFNIITPASASLQFIPPKKKVKNNIELNNLTEILSIVRSMGSDLIVCQDKLVGSLSPYSHENLISPKTESDNLPCFITLIKTELVEAVFSYITTIYPGIVMIDGASIQKRYNTNDYMIFVEDRSIDALTLLDVHGLYTVESIMDSINDLLEEMGFMENSEATVSNEEYFSDTFGYVPAPVSAYNMWSIFPPYNDELESQSQLLKYNDDCEDDNIEFEVPDGREDL